jgi:hypothetical protein
MIIVTLMGFFLGSKLINEQYALMAVPFVWLEAYRMRGAWRWIFLLLWTIPVGFAIFHVPIDRFFWMLYHMVLGEKADITIINGMTGFEWTMIPWKHPAYSHIIALFLAFSFMGLVLVAWLWPERPIRRFRHYPTADPKVAELDLTPHVSDDVVPANENTLPPAYAN